MTATGKWSNEFFDLYSKIVVQVLTDKRIQRKLMQELDKVFCSVDEKTSQHHI